MKIQTVSKDYFRDMLAVNNFKLDQSGITSERLEVMQTVFTEYVSGESISTKPDFNVEQMLRKLSEKMNQDLEKIPMKTWKNIRLMYLQMRKYRALDRKYLTSSVSPDELVAKTLKLYKKADKEFYMAAKSILENRKTVFYFNNLGIDQYYRCSTLNRNFISCNVSGYNTYPSFIHELQHGIDFKLFPNIVPFYDELNPIFFETLMCDELNKWNARPGIYGERIDNHNHLMRAVFNYVEILERFDNKGRWLTRSNVGSILGVDSEAELRKLFNKYYYDNLVQSVVYIMSFMQAIRIREIYYDSKKTGMKQLQDKLTGIDRKVGYSELIRSYDDFISEIEKSRVKKYTR